MEKIENNNRKFNRLFLYLKNNLQYVVGLVIFLLVIFSGFEYYKYNNLKNTKIISKNYFKAIENLYLNEIDSINLLNDISNSKNGFALMSSMKLIEIYLEKKEFNNAYNHYKIVISQRDLEPLYRDLIILHGCYNLLNNIRSSEIFDLMEIIDIDQSVFRSHFYEIKYINSINIINKNKLSKLNDDIQKDIEIIKSVKERVNKLNEYLQYK